MKKSWKFLSTAAVLTVLSAPAFATSATGGSAGDGAGGTGSAGSTAAAGTSSGTAAGTSNNNTDTAASNSSTAPATSVTANSNGTTGNSNAVTGPGGVDNPGTFSTSANINAGASTGINTGATPRTYGISNTTNTGPGINAGATTRTNGINSASNTSTTGAGFNTNDRRVLNDFVTGLPAGVRDSNASGNFRVGETLPRNTTTTALPSNVMRQIAPAPNGFSYVQAGTDVYLISNGDRRIVDRVGIR